ncbi:MAG: helix-turn-helix transcriptional regulator [Bacteroidales bacterium]|jgi:DNA-binding PadR family transcriptional regulator|nr:helix-turn-helix transcriptional regulator [Bacteroidales bacterium]
MNIISNQLYSGSLKTIVLKLLKEEGRMHGYAMTRRVDEITGGKIKLTYGALYPILHKLEHEKAVVATTGVHNNRTRVYYSLTPKGESQAILKIRELKEFIESLQKIVEPQTGLNYA